MFLRNEQMNSILLKYSSMKILKNQLNQKYFVQQSLVWSSIFSSIQEKNNSLNNSLRFYYSNEINTKYKNQTNKQLKRLFQPIDVKPMMKNENFSSNNSESHIGEELTGGKSLEKSFVLNENYF